MWCAIPSDLLILYNIDYILVKATKSSITGKAII